MQTFYQVRFRRSGAHVQFSKLPLPEYDDEASALAALAKLGPSWSVGPTRMVAVKFEVSADRWTSTIIALQPETA